MARKALKALVSVASLLREPVGSSQTEDISGTLAGEIEGFAQGKAKMTRTNRGVLVQCEFDAEVKLICSRCLNAFLCPISFTAEEEFVRLADVCGDSALSLPEQLEDFTIDDRNVLDLGELIRQYILLNLTSN